MICLKTRWVQLQHKYGWIKYHLHRLFKSEMRAMAVNDATETDACPVASNITQFTVFKVHRNCETPIWPLFSFHLFQPENVTEVFADLNFRFFHCVIPVLLVLIEGECLASHFVKLLRQKYRPSYASTNRLLLFLSLILNYGFAITYDERHGDMDVLLFSSSERTFAFKYSARCIRWRNTPTRCTQYDS